jgi:dephospho-CoA kinase
MDKIVVAYADEATELERLMARDGIGEADARARIQSPGYPTIQHGLLQHRQYGKPMALYALLVYSSFENLAHT